MKRFGTILYGFLLTVCEQGMGEDWKGIEVPVPLEQNQKWELLPVSDSFNYSASPMEKPESFHQRWKSSYINPWSGPGGTVWSPGHSYVLNGSLGIHASREEGTSKVNAGIITSKEAFTYPLYLEAKVKINNQVLASNVWLLSADSTEEIDVVEAYGSDRTDQEWFEKRVHLSHHVFIRDPFKDYQPLDEGSWYYNTETPTVWRHDFHRFGVYWRDPWHLEYYIDGELVRTVSGKEIIDPEGYTNETGLSKAMHIIINVEDQAWRRDEGITPTDEELADVDKSIMWVDWIRAYRPVKVTSE